MHIKQTHISTARPNLLKEHVSPTHGLTDRIKHENTTSCIVHLADSANFKGIASNKPCNGLIGSCFESPNDTIHVTVGSKRREPTRQQKTDSKTTKQTNSNKSFGRLLFG